MQKLTKNKPLSVLVVEDNDQVRRIVEVLLNHYGIPARAAAGGEAAVEMFRLHRDEIALVISDVQMPDLDGPGLLARLQAIDPGVRLCFMSGHTGAYTERGLLALGALRVLTKPFRASALRVMLTEIGIVGMAAAPEPSEASGLLASIRGS